ncbi:TM2 domain-containing protein [Pseudoalteromonas sp. MMG013]|uniref:TM2 domain-containing protein n=1 Tax=unclassified Pseudoalteromonas TaxID=194690 RepID=UPI001B390B44|nr:MULTISPECIES: TM2 domain-containing protein [unclassified Pseudoalteromonas]MBQ4845285.1 TM2 domain-containing protein [Pseudoalteromonas sp. MMG005]MBQ4852155.1 TM2 domain-containing protein [Pseudoalteromonas sp. MMG012]MBQ4863480.1 TM2 domain-containing protein [Pseudoalteromonas sp. MMG013]
MDDSSLRDQEEALRQAVSLLPQEARKRYYQLEQTLVKDPDTYAVLNYFFAAGLHHFYLGKTLKGIMNLALMLIGLATLSSIGFFIILFVIIIELPQLFRSQTIIRKHNIKVMENVINELQPRT